MLLIRLYLTFGVQPNLLTDSTTIPNLLVNSKKTKQTQVAYKKETNIKFAIEDRYGT